MIEAIAGIRKNFILLLGAYRFSTIPIPTPMDACPSATTLLACLLNRLTTPLIANGLFPIRYE